MDNEQITDPFTNTKISNQEATQKNGERKNQPDISSTDVKTAKQTNEANRTIGHYVVGRSLGQGTFGKVRLGTHILTNEKVAIKILEKDKIKDQGDVERVTRELQILKVVRHPNVIQLYEIIETSRQLFLIMEHANGGELFEYIVKRKRLQDDEACKFFQQIISGVEYIHKSKICHRDLKPENLLLDDRNNIKIVDFGLSNTYKNQDTLKTACGSPCYAAPEMIAGKQYHGLNSDIWSCGIILYAMACGYLPFEDPNTNKLYKKILSCDYLTPGFISKPCKDLIKKILNTDPATRITIPEIKNHEWFAQSKIESLDGIVIGKDRVPLIDEILVELKEHCGQEGLKDALVHIQNNKHNQITSTYYLLMKKLERETGKNYVYEQVTKDKKRNLYSTSNLSQAIYGSPVGGNSKLDKQAKTIMNQTVSGGFHKAVTSQNAYKSEGRPIRQNEGLVSNANPATKKYLEQMEKLYTKRTESTAQARVSDIMTNGHQQSERPVKSGNGFIQSKTQQFQGQNNQIQQRVTAQSQSPNGKLITNLQPGNFHNQTFYMAERLKKNSMAKQMRVASFNETHLDIVLSSNNDSRIQEVLPHVHRQGTKTSQLRATMQNVMKSRGNESINNEKLQSSDNGQFQGNQQINILNQKSLEKSNILTLTSFNPGNRTPYNNNNTQTNSSVVSKAIAQQKIRQIRMQKNKNIESSLDSTLDAIGYQQEVRKHSVGATAGATSINFHRRENGIFVASKPKRQQQSNRDENYSFDYANGTPPAGNDSIIANTDYINAAANNSFSVGPNSTASRFYNSSKHNRFVSNINSNLIKGSNGAPTTFQNNFVLPSALNPINPIKTFYNSKNSAYVKKQSGNQQPRSPGTISRDGSGQSPPLSQFIVQYNTGEQSRFKGNKIALGNAGEMKPIMIV